MECSDRINRFFPPKMSKVGHVAKTMDQYCDSQNIFAEKYGENSVFTYEECC
jgi:hypothetical protein